MSFKNGKTKALTFSFDDGNVDDVRLVEVLNRYGLKGTFNLNGGKLTHTGSWMYDGRKDVRQLNYTDHSHLYDGHEVACHSYTHPRLELLDAATLHNELALDKTVLEYLYSVPMRGMALPFGTWNDAVVAEAEANGFLYCRTIQATGKFDLPEGTLLHPTCHFKDKNINELADAFLATDQDDALFYLWGHSYELVTEDDWEAFEDFCRRIAGKDDVWYCTNVDVIAEVRAR